MYDEFGLSLLLKWAHEIALGMNYLHSEAPIKIIHRDLKSNNGKNKFLSTELPYVNLYSIFLLVLITSDGDEMICKICDFGSSRFGIQTTKMTVTGWVLPKSLAT